MPWARATAPGAFKAFYKVNDRYEIALRRGTACSRGSSRAVDEGGYIINQDYLYLQHRRKVTTQEKKTLRRAGLTRRT
jgi:hypothetical protein